MKKFIFPLLVAVATNSFAQTTPVQPLQNDSVLPDGAANPTSSPTPTVPTSQPTTNSALPDGLGPAPSQPLATPPSTVNPYERKATDLILFPNSNELILGVMYGAVNQKFSLEYDPLSGDLYESEIKTMYAGFGGLYAFNDQWAIGARISRVLKKDDDTTYGSASTRDGESENVESKGFTDPIFNVVYRALDVSKDRYDLNLFANLSPKFQDSENGSATEDGNVAKGKDLYSLGVEWGRRNSLNSWAIGLILNSHGNEESENTNNTKTKITSYTTFDFLADVQWVLSNQFSLELNLGLGSTGEYKVKFSDGSYLEVEDAAEFKFGTTGNIEFADRLYLSVVLAGYAQGPTDAKNNDGENYTLKDITRGEFTLTLYKQF